MPKSIIMKFVHDAEVAVATLYLLYYPENIGKHSHMLIFSLKLMSLPSLGYDTFEDNQKSFLDMLRETAAKFLYNFPARVSFNNYGEHAFKNGKKQNKKRSNIF